MARHHGGMSYETRKPRHYEPPEGLILRSRGDVSPEAMAQRERAGALLEGLQAPRPEQPALVSSAHGRLERLLLTVPAYAVHHPALAAAYRDLLVKVGHTDLVVLTHESVRAAIDGWLGGADREGSHELIEVPDHLHFSVWAEDAYVVVDDVVDARSFFVEPYAFPRYADGLIADFVANATDMESTQAPLYFQGGNLLIGDDFFLIGADYPANTMKYIGSVLQPEPGVPSAEFIRRLYSEYMDRGRRLHYVGSTIPVPAQTSRRVVIDGETWTEHVHLGNREGTVQPLFHIDMFITLAGRDDDGSYQVLVGDPRLAAAILDLPLVAHAMVEVFDNIARGLERLGFVVHRNPLPLVYVDDEVARQRTWYFATSNNALVEITEETRHVWLPTYGYGAWAGLAATDAANAETWAKLGFEVEPLGDFHPFAENLGAVHCIKKSLGRRGREAN